MCHGGVLLFTAGRTLLLLVVSDCVTPRIFPEILPKKEVLLVVEVWLALEILLEQEVVLELLVSLVMGVEEAVASEG